MKDFFLKISDRLSAEVPKLRLIDLEKGQTNDPDATQGLAFPAALIDIAFPSCDDTSGRDQQCRVNVTVRVVDKTITDETSHLTPTPWRERSLAILDTVQSVVNALQGFDCGFSSPLSRTSQQPESGGDTLKVYRIVFTSTFDEVFDE